MTWRRGPLLPLAAAFAGGIAAAPLATPVAATVAWAVATAAGAGCVALARPLAATIALMVAVIAVGALHGASPPAPRDDVSRLDLPRTARVEGRLLEEPLPFQGAPGQQTPERTRLLLDVERVGGEPRTGTLQLTAYGTAPPLTQGQRVALEARLDRPVGFRNPGTFDHAERLARHGIAVVGTTHADRIEAPEAEPPWNARVRRFAVTAMREALPPVSAALLAGLLLGERTGLPPEVDAAFRRAGVYHVLAVSGFNVALVASTAWTVLALARAPRRLTSLSAIAVVLGFAAVVGPQPSVLRATIMAVLVLGALLLEREAAVLNSLALAALVILALRPDDLRDPGFQLSFAATAGIVLAPMPRNPVLAALAVSAAAQAAVLPVALAHFNQVSTIGVVANLAVVPLAGLATILGLVAAALAALSPLVAGWLFAAVWPVLLLLRWVVALAAAVPGAVVHLPAPGAVAITAYATALALGLTAWHLRVTRLRAARRMALAAGALALISALLTLWPALRPADGRLRVSVLDVGQGDAIVIEGPDGRTVLVDAGAGGPYRLDTGERVVAPFLWNRGILRLAAVVVTHPDIDHAGGMAAVRDLFTVREPWDGAPERGTLALGGALLTPLPSAAVGRNDAARVLRLEFGRVAVLLTSDVERAGEHALITSGAPLGATVLKVPHHGSRTSSSPELLAAVRPALAIVSVGVRNAYGHPDAGVLARLAAAGADLYRTDRDGAVLLETDGRTLEVTRWVSRARTRYCLDPDTPC
ncbi:MAG TPA: DNA internalization-related competence protein ComEC/Rec2 [Candidatus Binatia bacterium]|nr:DNA internalization-related competence protein ComEC/Rec2 [Candidatus Binatia bacterium]